MIAAKYQHLISIRFWKGKCQDQGLRIICDYMLINNNLILLELMNCAITPLGCEFLTRGLDPSLGSTLSVLKLDYNPEIGDAGIAILAECLMKNKVLTMVSLAYCGITAVGAESLF